jgi:hypothetical protein
MNDLIKLDWFDWNDFVSMCNNHYDESIKEKTKQVEQDKREQFEKIKNIKSVYKN